MDPIKYLQETLEQSLIEMNKDAMKTLAAQIVAIVTQLQNGDPSKVMLMWEAGNEPEPLQKFIAENWKDHYTYSVLLPVGQRKTDLELARLGVVELNLPQNKLLLYYSITDHEDQKYEGTSGRRRLDLRPVTRD